MGRLKLRRCGAVLLVLLTPVLAGDQDDAQRLRETGAILSLQQVIAGDAELARARILEVELEDQDGRYRYEIEYLNGGGRVLEGLFDAATGERLHTAPED